VGTWGTGLYDDDTACEVRDDYIKNLKEGLSDAEAFQKILNGYKGTLRNVQVATNVYLALADTQWKYGRLDPQVKKRALALLEQGADLREWNEDAPKLVSAREKVLATLEKRLGSKPKPRRAIKVVPPKPLGKWTDAKLGTVFLLPLSKQSFAALVLVANIETGYRTKDPMFSVLQWKGRKEPTLAELRNCKLVDVPEDSGPDAEKCRCIGFLTMDARKSPLEGLIPTNVVLPKAPRYNGSGLCTGRERIAELVAAGIAGRQAPLTEWDRKFGRGRRP
jgi:hypothetical protein